MKEIVYRFKCKNIRTIIDDNEEYWFVADDIAMVMEISHNNYMHYYNTAVIEDNKRTFQRSELRIIRCPCKTIKTINIDGVSVLCLKSESAYAKDMIDWLRREIVKKPDYKAYIKNIKNNTRQLLKDDRIYYCAVDVAKALGYPKPRSSVDKYCRNIYIKDADEQSNLDELAYIPSSDIYRLIVHSKQRIAKQFAEWIFGSVIPGQIRQLS